MTNLVAENNNSSTAKLTTSFIVFSFLASTRTRRLGKDESFDLHQYVVLCSHAVGVCSKPYGC